LAVRYGAEFARWEYTLCMIVAALVPVILWWQCGFPPTMLAASLALLPGLLLARQLWRREGTSLNPILAQTAGVLLLLTLVISSISVLT
jgi:1,4-dihydroxy-2-naphthoate octaprenyltransferase